MRLFLNQMSCCVNSILNEEDPVIRRRLQRLIINDVIKLIVCLIKLAMCLYLDISCDPSKHQCNNMAYEIFLLVTLILSVLNTILGLSLAIYERLKGIRIESLPTRYRQWNYIHLIINGFLFITFSIIFIINFVKWSGALHTEAKLRNNIRLIALVLVLCIVLGHSLSLLWNRILAWSPHYRYSRAAIFLLSCMLIAVSIVALILNYRVHFMYPVAAISNVIPLWCYRAVQTSASYTLVLGCLGIVLTIIYRKRMKSYRRVTLFFHILCVIAIIFVVISTIIIALYDISKYEESMEPNLRMLIYADTVLSVIRCLLIIFEMAAAGMLQRVNRTGKKGLFVERIDLNKQKPILVKHWADAIDRYSETTDGMTGEAALQLMMAYEVGQLQDVTCVVLRISRPKNQVVVSPDQFDDTEAIVLLTIIHRYDSTYSIPVDDYWKTFLRKTLGSDNCIPFFRPVLLKLGLLGYQWPFRTGIFFTSPQYDTRTAGANVVRTILEWNESQSSKLHSDIILLPALISEPIVKSIAPAGLFPLPLPPTHLLDLRPHRGKTWNEYMKTLKKDNRRPYMQQFLNKGGVIEEIHDLAKAGVAETICDQWSNIARVRNENSEPPTLARPSVQFITTIGEKMIEPYRSVVFLRFNNEVIATSVIFKFPHKLLTTDIQGLTHEKARPVKAYFVMLQWVIKEALEKGFDFVDFGPTTPGPKTDLGCKQIEMKAAGYSTNPILAYGIKKAGSVVDTVHTKKETSKSVTSKNPVDSSTSKSDQQPAMLHENENNDDRTVQIDVSDKQTLCQSKSEHPKNKVFPKKSKVQSMLTGDHARINRNSQQTEILQMVEHSSTAQNENALKINQSSSHSQNISDLHSFHTMPEPTVGYQLDLINEVKADSETSNEKIIDPNEAFRMEQVA